MPPKMSATERQDQIREELERVGNVTISSLAERLGVSEMTIRRDLDDLEKAGVAQRTHGGATVAERLVFELDFRQQQSENRESKRLIAREALKFIQPGSRLMLDTGTTTLELAALLDGWNDLTVITTSLAVVSQLQFAEGVQTVLLGGVLRRGNPDLTGGVTEHCLELFAADIAFQGADAIDNNGDIYNSDLRLARVDRRMRQRSAKTYILADSTKIGHTALARNGSLSEVDALITDAGISPSTAEHFRALGMRVIIAKKH